MAVDDMVEFDVRVMNESPFPLDEMEGLALVSSSEITVIFASLVVTPFTFQA